MTMLLKNGKKQAMAVTRFLPMFPTNDPFVIKRFAFPGLNAT